MSGAHATRAWHAGPARVLQAKGEYAQAEQDFRRALAIVLEVNGPEVSEAEPLLRAASTTLNGEPFAVQWWQLADANSQLGICPRKLGRARDGEALVQASLSGLGLYPEPAIRSRLLHLTSQSIQHP